MLQAFPDPQTIATDQVHVLDENDFFRKAAWCPGLLHKFCGADS